MFLGLLPSSDTGFAIWPWLSHLSLWTSLWFFCSKTVLFPGALGVCRGCEVLGNAGSGENCSLCIKCSFFCFLYEGRERSACRDLSDIRDHLYMDLHKHTGKTTTSKAPAHSLKSSHSCTSNSLKCWFCKVLQANG